MTRIADLLPAQTREQILSSYNLPKCPERPGNTQTTPTPERIYRQLPAQPWAKR